MPVSPFWLLSLWFWLASLSAGALWSYGSAFVVLLGVVGETITELTEWIKPECVRKRVAKISAIVLIIGLTGDLLGIRETQIEVASLTKQAGDAATSAKTAHEEADAVTGIADEARADAKDALAKAQAAQGELAHSEADSAKAAAAASDALTMAGKVTEEVKATKEQADEIRDEIAWRHLSSVDSKKIRDAIPASLRGYKIEVRHLLSDPEAGQYASEIADALRSILNVDGTSGYLGPWGRIPQGIGLYVKSLTMPGAIDVQRALKAGGIEANGVLLSDANLSSATGIVIFVWPKPLAQGHKTNKQTTKP